MDSPGNKPKNNILTDLAQKGELVLAKPGRPIVLETKAIQVIARMVECSLAAGGSPKDNYFESLSIEFQVRLK